MTTDIAEAASGAPSPIELTALTASLRLLELYRRSHEQGLAPEEVSEMITRAITLSGSRRKDDQREAVSLLRSTLSAPRDEIDIDVLHELTEASVLGFHIGAERTESNCPFGRTTIGLPDSLEAFGELTDLEIIERTFGDWRRRSEEDNDALVFHRGELVAAYTDTRWAASPEELPDGTARGAVGRSYISTADVVVIRQTRAEPVAARGYTLEVRPDKDGFLRPEITADFEHDLEDESMISYAAQRIRTRPSAHQAIDLLQVTPPLE